MTKVSRTLLVVFLTIASVASCQKTLAADLPQGLAPSNPKAFWCLDKAGAQQAETDHQENLACHDQIEKSEGHTDWLTIGVVILLSGLAGFAIGTSR